jgi:alkanesulfonate monooxygenase SsuD/methylene tetrahydromethanopterin reductase-like flavin-dependent oxidoreductase (luciferase family)
MHYGIEVVPFGDFADPRQIVQIAKEAEATGWEGLWIWDHVVMPWGTGDPWITLAAVAASTKQLKLCLGVAPVPRYRPHLLARTLTGLDLLSDGRVIFGTGSGIPSDFIPFDEPAEAKVRAEMLDEGLDLMTRYLSGQPVTYHGKFYHAEAVQIIPSPIQKPRLPIWIGGGSKAALRRAARWDGWIMGTVDENSHITYPPEKIAVDSAFIRAHRTVPGPFDIAVDGVSQPGVHSVAKEYAEAGATWWFEAIHLSRGPYEEQVERIKAGPPVE